MGDCTPARAQNTRRYGLSTFLVQPAGVEALPSATATRRAPVLRFTGKPGDPLVETGVAETKVIARGSATTKEKALDTPVPAAALDFTRSH